MEGAWSCHEKEFRDTSNTVGEGHKQEGLWKWKVHPQDVRAGGEGGGIGGRGERAVHLGGWVIFTDSCERGSRLSTTWGGKGFRSISSLFGRGFLVLAASILGLSGASWLLRSAAGQAPGFLYHWPPLPPSWPPGSPLETAYSITRGLHVWAKTIELLEENIGAQNENMFIKIFMWMLI